MLIDVNKSDVEAYYEDTVLRHTMRAGEVIFEIDEEHHHETQEIVADPKEPLNALKTRIKTTITVAGNRHQAFQPVESRPRKGMEPVSYVRSRLELERFGGLRMRFSMDPALQSLHSIPGERIHIHLDKRIGRITDAIFDSENKDIRFQLYKAGKSMEKSHTFALAPGEYFEQDLSHDESAYWNWLFWMRRILDGDREHDSGPARHPGCSLSGPRLCRPVQNCEMMPGMLEIIRSKKIMVEVPKMSREQFDGFDEENKLEDPDYVPVNRRRGTMMLTPRMMGIRTDDEALVD